MAASNQSRQQDTTQAGISREIFEVIIDDNTFTVITPTKIKAIHFVSIIPINKVMATNIAAIFLNDFEFGDATVTIQSSDVASDYVGGRLLVKIEGSEA